MYINSLFIDLQLCIITKVTFIYSNIKTNTLESLSLSSFIYKVRAYDVLNIHAKSFFFTLCTKFSNVQRYSRTSIL